MKRIYLFLVFLALLAIPVMAQEIEGPSIDFSTMEAILVLVTGGIVTMITGLLKTALKVTGTLAVILTGVVAVGATAVYFLFINPPLVLATFALYAVVIFGEATGYFHFYQKVR